MINYKVSEIQSNTIYLETKLIQLTKSSQRNEQCIWRKLKIPIRDVPINNPAGLLQLLVATM